MREEGEDWPDLLMRDEGQRRKVLGRNRLVTPLPFKLMKLPCHSYGVKRATTHIESETRT